MKLWLFFGMVSVIAGQRFTDRYIQDNIVCPDVKTCQGDQGGMKCKGRYMTSPKGRIRLQSKTKLYGSNFHCRWEIKAPKGLKIRIKITQGHNKFGIEHHKTCGFDKLHVQSIDGERYGRLCSTKLDAGLTYNGLSAYQTYNQVKIPSKEWQDWITLPTDHLVIAFDSDRLQESNRGFRLVYDTVGDYFVPNEVREEIKSLKSDENDLLNRIFSPADKFYKRLEKRIDDHFDQIFEKWHACGGASLDPTMQLPKEYERNSNEIDKTEEIKAIYQRYRKFITSQLEDVGTCMPKHVRKIVSPSHMIG